MCFPFRSPSHLKSLLLASGVLLAFDTGCPRSQRLLHETAPMNAPAGGPRSGAGDQSVRNPYEDNAYAETEGQRLYDRYNCSGCHARGGGGIGPPLMADVFRYGKEPGNIYSSIVDGAPTVRRRLIRLDRLARDCAHAPPHRGQPDRSTEPNDCGGHSGLYCNAGASLDPDGKCSGGSCGSDAGGSRRAANRDRRSSVVVGSDLSRRSSQRHRDYRQRDPCCGRSSCPARALVHRCDSQLLGSQSQRQEGFDSRTADSPCVSTRTSGSVRRALRRILRLPARAHGISRDR